MTDSAISFAIIAMLSLGWPVALVMWLECRKRGHDIDDVMMANLSAEIEIDALRSRLTQASKNDHRDERGRFAKAS